MSGTWPGFSADWEESSEYQELRWQAKLERQANTSQPIRSEPCPECGLPVEERPEHAGAVYRVHRVCPFCEWRDVDTEGGI